MIVDGRDGLQIWRVAVKKVNRQSWTAKNPKRGSHETWGGGLYNSSP
jgi:hypothetical protein